MAPTVEDEKPDVADRPDAHASYNVGRLLAFSDGVFAIAITLLVLGIPIPDVRDADRLPAELRGLTPNLIGFALSFVLVGTQWIAHHRLLRDLRFSNGTILWINLVLLMGICLVPFATSLLVRYGYSPAGAIPYATLQAGIGLVFVLYRLYLMNHGVDLRQTLALSWMTTVAFLVSIPLALKDVNLCYGVWVAGFAIARMWAAGAVPRALGRLRRWTRSAS